MSQYTNGKSLSANGEHVLVTGGAGYIGSALVPILLERGYRVTVFDQFVYGIFPLLPVVSDTNLKIIKGNVCNVQELKAAISDDITCVVHLAAIVGYPACSQNPELAVQVNEMGTQNVADCIKSHQKIVFASTGSCYGAIDNICTEETQICPLTLYGKTKAKGEEIVLSRKGVVLRLATLFGISHRMRLDLLINDLTNTLLTERKVELYEANFRRTFLHVKDAAQAFYFAIANYSKMSGQVYNVGNESMNMTKKMVAEKIIQQMPFPCELILSNNGEDKDKRDYEVSYSKIKHLGFKSTIMVEEGIEELIKTLPQMSLWELKLSKNI